MGSVGKITSSFLVQYSFCGDKQVMDLGLNIKNFTRKVHIADYVRFVAAQDKSVDNQYGNNGYSHNTHARGAKHVRKHWEFSQEVFDVLKEYKKRAPGVFECVARSFKKDKPVQNLRDLYYDEDQDKAIEKVKEIVSWIEKLPLSNLPYVEMGFDSLSADLISKIDEHKNSTKPASLNCKDSLWVNAADVYQEHFPFWCGPFYEKQVDYYKVGDRVLNINSVGRIYVPFGLRGTVVGKTSDKVIVLFDEQYLNGHNIYGHGEEYRGGFIDPTNLLNLTKKFTSLSRKDPQLALSFTEGESAQITPIDE